MLDTISRTADVYSLERESYQTLEMRSIPPFSHQLSNNVEDIIIGRGKRGKFARGPGP